jgi:pimeloyl-ACP methyl ester carboxylesterase
VETVAISHRFVDTNGIHMHIAEEGDGPLVLLCHGFPESWYSYRHQIEALAGAGYHAVAPDLRGYGQTDAPEDLRQYSLLHIAGDLVGLIEALGAERCVVVGHDWGSPVASTLGLFRPDLVRGVALLSVPYLPRGDSDQLSQLIELLGPHNYQVFFQEPGVAEVALEADVRATVLGFLIGASGDVEEVNTLSDVRDGVLFPNLNTAALPGWLTDEDVDYFVTEYERTGYRGGLNWYRNSRQNWELMAAWHRAPLLQRSLFIGGDRDLVFHFPGFPQLVQALPKISMPFLTKAIVLEGCGHWTQQERPAEVNELLVEFLAGLPD